MFQRNTGSTQAKLIVLGVIAFFGLIGIVLTFRFVEAQGSERIVWQTFTGVKDTVGQDGLHYYCPMITTPNPYYIGSDTFIIATKATNPNNSYMGPDELQFNEPDVPPVKIPVQMDKLTEQDLAEGKSTGPTDVLMSCVMQYHLSPKDEHLVALHKDKTTAYRTTFLKDVLLRIINDKTTVLDARTVYQGAGRVQLQKSIESALQSEPRFKKYGITVERFILKEVEFVDKEFLHKIQEEALAQQRKKTAEKQKDANLAEADAEEAKAMSEQKRRLVEAQTKKNEQIARAEAEKEQQILAAQAEAEKIRLSAEAGKERLRLQGEGQKLQQLAQAEGILAVGKAEAEARRLKLLAYQGEGGQRFAEVEKAKALGAGIQKIYYIPADMGINTISSDFNNAITVGLPDSDRDKR